MEWDTHWSQKAYEQGPGLFFSFHLFIYIHLSHMCYEFFEKK